MSSLLWDFSNPKSKKEVSDIQFSLTQIKKYTPQHREAAAAPAIPQIGPFQR